MLVFLDNLSSIFFCSFLPFFIYISYFCISLINLWHDCMLLFTHSTAYWKITSCKYFSYCFCEIVSWINKVCLIDWLIFFLEICLLTNARRIASVIATTTCDTFVLSTSDFHEVLEDYPEMRAKMERVAEERLNSIKNPRYRRGAVSPRMDSISHSADCARV